MEPKYLIELFLPLFDDRGRKLPARLYEDVRRQLVDRFGGMTAHLRAPATGLWRANGKDRVERDVLIIYEVMVPRLKRRWWSSYRRELEETFQQQEVLVRVQRIKTI